MDVCSGCGTVNPMSGSPCGVCATRERTRAPASGDAGLFVSARLQFQCRGCGRLAPIDEVELGDLARCGLCGLTQAFDATVWSDALDFAHAVGDLAGGEGRHPSATWSIGGTNPFREVGVTEATATVNFAGSTRVDGLTVRRSLRVNAGPGHPLCATCKTPLRVELAPGAAITRCPGCAETTRYSVPPGLARACPSLRAVLADSHRAEQAEARPVETDGILALSCPGCGAPLPVNGHATVTCSFCHLACRVPGAAAHGAELAPSTLWLLFHGPSPQRRALESGRPPTKKGKPPDGEEAFPIRPAPVATARTGGFLVRLLPSVLVAGGMTAATGIVLFGLMQAGLIRL